MMILLSSMVVLSLTAFLTAVLSIFNEKRLKFIDVLLLASSFSAFSSAIFLLRKIIL